MPKIVKASKSQQSSKRKQSSEEQSQSQQSPLLELRILTSQVGIYPPPPSNITGSQLASLAMTAGPPNSANTTSPSESPFTYLLSGPLSEFLDYSRQEKSKWLIDIAHDICDPSLKRGSLQKVLDTSGGMRIVKATDPLTASVYQYKVQAVVALSKISERAGKSKTSDGPGNASTMVNLVKQRDQHKCWLSRTTQDRATTNSHICPKRMGDHILHVIYSDFVSTPPANLSIFDEVCGITLNRNLDGWFDMYELGLRYVSQVRGSFLLFFVKSFIHS